MTWNDVGSDAVQGKRMEDVVVSSYQLGGLLVLALGTYSANKR